MTIAADIFTYGPPINLATNCVGYYRNSFQYNTAPDSLIWQNNYNSFVDPAQMQNDPAQIGDPTYSYPIRNTSDYSWSFIQTNKNVFWSNKYISGPSAPLGSFSIAINFKITDGATYGQKIMGLQSTLPNAIPTSFDKQFWVSTNSPNRLYFGMFDVRTNAAVAVAGPSIGTNTWYVATATYSSASRELIIYVNRQTTDFKANIQIDERTDQYAVVGGGFLNTSYTGAKNGIRFITGNISTVGIWNKCFSEQEVRLLQAYMSLN